MRRIVALGSQSREIVRLLPMFGNTGIERRYSCVPIEWYENLHEWPERNQVYLDSALDLLESATRRALERAQRSADEIDAIVTVSTTGIATPSLDALLMERMQLRRTVKRLPIFGLGCAGGAIGLSRAGMLARSSPSSLVLFLVVELCALTFRKNDLTKSNFVATALFGDGAAGAILSTDGDGPAFGPAGEHTWPDSLGIMGWDVEEDGLKAIFSQSIPALVANDFSTILHAFLVRNDLKLGDIDKFACHPGGAKVLDALEDAFQIERGSLEDSRAVLRDFGNMSAVTALFVLERMDWRRKNQRILMTALGPGFSATFQVLEG